MPRSDDRRAKVGVLQLQHSLRQSLDGRSGGLLHKQVSLLAVRKGIKNEVDGITERHHEAGHIGIRDRQGLPLVDLVAEPREAMTLPYRVRHRTGSPGSICRERAITFFSMTAFVMPMALMG